MKTIRTNKNGSTDKTDKKMSVYDKIKAASLNPDKTILPPIDNQYTVSLCQDLVGTTVLKINNIRIENFLTRFYIIEIQYVTNFLSGFVRI